MDLKKATYLNIGISILFAVAMILSSYFLDGSEFEQTATNLLIALWFIPFALLSRASLKAAEKQPASKKNENL